MSDVKKRSAAARAHLAALQNPYVWVQVDANEQDGEKASSVAQTSSPTPVQTQPRAPYVKRGEGRLIDPKQPDLFGPDVDVKADIAPKHPYEVLARLSDEEDSQALAERVPEPSEYSVSKADFESGCRGIFAQYLPALERLLRPEQRAFIERNKVRTPSIRYRLLMELKKYDLTHVVGLRPQFNRNESLATEKLLQIEQSVGEDS